MKQVDIIVSHNSGLKWWKEGQVYVKGYAWIDNRYYSGRLLARYLARKNKETVIKIAEKLNGNYAIVLDTDSYCIAVVDRLRSIPLFYSSDGSIITDDPVNINSRYKIHIDKTSFAELVTSGMYTGNDRTLFCDIKQIPAGNKCIISKNIDQGCKLEQYYVHRHISANKTKENFYQDIMRMSESIFYRLVMSAQGKTILIPLSGGYDSRYIAAMLKKIGYSNVVCYTYGKTDSYEVKNARLIANELELKWFFVEYEEKKWAEIEKTVVNEYCNRAFMYSSIPHLQEVIALQELCKNPEFPKEGIVAPGFCGDILGGSIVLSDLETQLMECNKEWVTAYIINKHYYMDKLNTKYRQMVVKDIEQCIDDFQIDINTKEGVQDFIEAWFAVHRPAKYIIQSCRLYELFGYEWRLPLWDQEMMDLWYSVPLELRKGKLLYDQWLFETLFDPMNISCKKISTYKNYEEPFVKRYKDLIRKVIGVTWLTFGIKLREKGDPNGFKYLSRYLFKKLENRYEYNYTNQNINYLAGLWTLEKYLGPGDTLRLYQEVTGKK